MKTPLDEFRNNTAPILTEGKWRMPALLLEDNTEDSRRRLLLLAEIGYWYLQLGGCDSIKVTIDKAIKRASTAWEKLTGG